jgi:hypothetical protein
LVENEKRMVERKIEELDETTKKRNVTKRGM